MNKLNLALTIASMQNEIEALKEENREVQAVIESGVNDDLSTRLAMIEMYEILIISYPEKAEGSEAMAKVYASLIKNGLRTIDQVPKILTRQVGVLLEK